MLNESNATVSVSVAFFPQDPMGAALSVVRVATFSGDAIVSAPIMQRNAIRINCTICPEERRPIPYSGKVVIMLHGVNTNGVTAMKDDFAFVEYNPAVVSATQDDPAAIDFLTEAATEGTGGKRKRCCAPDSDSQSANKRAKWPRTCAWESGQMKGAVELAMFAHIIGKDECEIERLLVTFYLRHEYTRGLFRSLDFPCPEG